MAALWPSAPPPPEIPLGMLRAVTCDSESYPDGYAYLAYAPLRTIGAHSNGYHCPPPRGPALSASWASGGATPPVLPEFDSESGLRLPALAPQRAMGGDQYAAIPAAPLPRGDGYSAGGSNHLVASSPLIPAAPLPRSEGYSAGGSNHLVAPPPPLPVLTRQNACCGSSPA